MLKIKNLILKISPLIITCSISGCSFQRNNETYNNLYTPAKIEFELNDQNLTYNKIHYPALIAPPSPPETNISQIKETNKKSVALTFDDGPSKYTQDLLDLLDEYNVKATFFVLGCNNDNYYNTLLQAVENGHEIAIHGNTHTSFTDLGVEETNNEIITTINYLESLGINASELVRPPYGSLNDDLRQNINYPFILWNIDTEDWKSKDKEQIKQKILDDIQEGDIILMHDTNVVHEVDMEVLKEILPDLTKEYKFITVSELVEENNKTLENGKAYGKIKSEK